MQARFLRRDRGTYGGYGWVGEGNDVAPSPTTPLDGLLCVGDSNFPGTRDHTIKHQLLLNIKWCACMTIQKVLTGSVISSTVRGALLSVLPGLG